MIVCLVEEIFVIRRVEHEIKKVWYGSSVDLLRIEFPLAELFGDIGMGGRPPREDLKGQRDEEKKISEKNEHPFHR